MAQNNNLQDSRSDTKRTMTGQIRAIAMPINKAEHSRCGTVALIVVARGQPYDHRASRPALHINF